ncbi:PI-PLC X domain-containing protein 3, partial [Blattella germanica]
RYLDLRLGTKPETRDAFIVHGQFGATVEQIFQEVNTFLADHDGEIVILDFQHFYSFSQETHSYLMSLIDSYFGNRLCPLSRIISHISLRWMREKGYQVIAIYRNDAALGIPTLWPSSRWPTPWPETTSITTMFMFLEEKMSVRPADAGFVTQCVLTPDVKFFLKNCFSTLEKKCAIPCNHAIIPWLQKQRPGSKGINVVICDFVKMKGINFCKTVVQLNATLLDDEKITRGY